MAGSPPVAGGWIFKVRFAIGDKGDHIPDSAVLIDHVTWDIGQGNANTQPIPS